MDLREDRRRLERILLGQEAAVNEVRTWLEEEDAADAIVEAAIRSSTTVRTDRLQGLDPSRLFSGDAVRDLCVRYRLRLLPAGLYKGALPRQAIGAVRALEAAHQTVLHGFQIMAPARRFKLCDADGDPLLFVGVDEDRYYLVHRWGSDLSPWRAVLHWPLRSLLNLALTVVAVALLFTLLMPNGVLTRDPAAGWWGGHRLLFGFWTIWVVMAFTVQGWFAFHGRFSREAWNSRTFN